MSRLRCAVQRGGQSGGNDGPLQHLRQCCAGSVRRTGGSSQKCPACRRPQTSAGPHRTARHCVVAGGPCRRRSSIRPCTRARCSGPSQAACLSNSESETDFRIFRRLIGQTVDCYRRRRCLAGARWGRSRRDARRAIVVEERSGSGGQFDSACRTSGERNCRFHFRDSQASI